MPVIPDLPGNLVPRNSEQESWLKAQVAKICHMDRPRFPGSQPVSFGMRDLDKLESADYWVCEKSDGVRVLFLINTDLASGDQALYLIDRHNTYHQLTGIFFPHHENPMRPLGNTLIDGELVIDVDPRTKQETLRLLCFDCLVVNDQNVMSRPLDKRYGRLTEWFYKPYAKMMKDHPHMAASQPFDIKVKEINFSYHVEKVFAVDIPALHHENDGLIYTCVSTPYTPGTDTNIMKWKPPTENSIDFKLVLRFPPLRYQADKPDFHAKPIFLLHVWCGDERGVAKYEQYDEMYVDDEEWEKLKLSREQIDDRIVEVHWDAAVSHWRMMRFRDDKPNGNHRNVVENIIQSIIDGVEKDALLARSNAIRNAWKSRLGQPSGSQPQLQQQSQSQPHPPPQSQMRPPAPPVPRMPTRPLKAEIRYGPLASSPWSKVAGPEVMAGMKR
ncbi:mRNA capping enzyme [Lyophyllum atratum]|nr:mRNA capping enzyme [Lyophyllum atratum]